MKDSESVKEQKCSICEKEALQVEILISSQSDVRICNECVDLCVDIISENKKEEPSKEFKLKTPKEIYEQLNQYIVGQDEAKKTLSVAVYNHYKRISAIEDKNLNSEVDIEKSNILILGASGTGKTLLAQTIAKMLDVPFVIADATSLTEAGYVGEDVENIISKLLFTSNFCIEKTERGIIFIDEIDKITRKSEGASTSRDVSGEGVQQALLKLIEGTVANIIPEGGRKHPNQDTIQINTKNILFICGGAFVGIDKIMEKNSNIGAKIGFDSKIKDKDFKNISLNNVTSENLAEYGLINEFIGRLPIRVGLEDLSLDDMALILTEPKNAVIKQFQLLFKLDGVDFEVTKSAILEIAKDAIKNKTGARGLRAKLERILKVPMFEIPEMPEVCKVIVDVGQVEETSPPKYVKGVRKMLTKNDDDDASALYKMTF